MKGSLKDFSVENLLAHLANNKVTGILNVSHKKIETQIDWLQGRIVSVTSSLGGTKDTLGEMLLSIGEIDRNQLKQAILQQKTSLSPLGMILQKDYGCESTTIKIVLKVQAIESLCSLLFWKEGSYVFESKSIQIPENTYSSIDVVKFLSQSTSVVQEWPKLRKNFPNLSMKIRLLKDDVPSHHLNILDENSVDLFNMLGNQTNYRALSILSGMGRFITGYGLVQLSQIGVIRFESAKKERINVGRLIFGGSFLQFVFWSACSYLLIVVFMFIFLYSSLSPFKWLKSGNRFTLFSPIMSESLNTWKQVKIRNALKFYFQFNGEYPIQLSLLVKEGWIEPNLILDTSGKTYFYEKISKDKYKLIPSIP